MISPSQYDHFLPISGNNDKAAERFAALSASIAVFAWLI
jgi:hypothetical protein